MKLFRKNKVKNNEKTNPYITSLLLAKWEFVKYLAEHDDDDDDAWIIFSSIVEDIDLFLEGSVYYCDFDTILKEIAEGYELLTKKTF